MIKSGTNTYTHIIDTCTYKALFIIFALLTDTTDHKLLASQTKPSISPSPFFAEQGWMNHDFLWSSSPRPRWLLTSAGDSAACDDDDEIDP